MANPYDQFDAPAAADAPTEPVAPAQEAASLSLGDRAVDLARAGVGGLRDIAQGVVQTPLVLGELLTPLTAPVFGNDPKAQLSDIKDLKEKTSFSEVEAPKTWAGIIGRQVVKWGVGLAGMGATTLIKGGVAATVKGAAAVGAGSFVLTDPQEQNLSNLVESVPQLHNPVTEFLAADPKDSDAENKLKGALENIIMTPMAEGLIIGLKATKAAIALRRAGKPAEAAKVMEEAAPKVEEALGKAVSDPVQPEIFPAQKVAEAGVSSQFTISDNTLYKGERRGAVMGSNDEMFVARTAEGKDVGFMHVTKVEGGYEVRKVEVEKAFQRKGIATDLDKEAQRRYGEYKGSTDLTPEGEAFRQSRQVQDATARVANKEAILERFTISKDEGGQAALQGNINYAKYGDDNTIKQLMSDVVATTKKNLPDLMGSYQSQKETADLARILGKDPTDLYTSLAAMRMSSADMAAHVIAGKALVKRVATDLFGVATKLSNGLGTDMDKVAFAHMTDVLTSSMDHVAALTTEAARTTAAGRMRVGMAGITKENFASLLEKVGGSDAVLALSKRIAAAGDEAGVVAAVKGTPGKITAIHNFIWMNGVLGGLKTSVVNLSTTAFNSALMPGYRIIGGLADMAISGQGREEVLKGLYQYRMFTHVWGDSLRMAAKAFKQGEGVLDASSNPLMAKAGNLLSQDFTGIENEVIGRGLEYIGKAVGLPSKFLIAQDEFFKQAMYRSHVMSNAYVDGLKAGLDGDWLKAFINERLTTSIGQAGQGLDNAALTAAKAATFTQDLAAVTLHGNRTLSEGIAGFANSHPVVKGLILPFVKVPTNLLRQAWDMTPALDLLRTQFRTDLAAGGEARAMALGKMGVGTAMWGTAIGLAMNGRITGSGPRDKELLRQLGPDWKPYSFVFHNSDGTKEYISFARLDPFATFFGLAADSAEIGGKLGEKEYAEAAVKMTMGLVKNLASKTYLRALTDAMEALTGDEPMAKKYFQSRAASYVPGIVQLLNPDDELKNIRGWFDGMRSRVPGWSSTLEAKRDNFGEKVMPPMGYPYTAFNPFTFFRSTADPVRQELAGLARDDIEAKFPLPSPTFGPKESVVDLRDIKNASGQSAYDRWMELHSKLEIGGRTLHESMGDLIATPMYQQAREALGKGDPTYKASLATDLVRKQFDLYEKVTYQQLIKEYPGLGESMQQFKIGQRVGRVQGSRTATPIDELRKLAGEQ